MNEIVVGVDRSDTARRAAEQAAELARCARHHAPHRDVRQARPGREPRRRQRSVPDRLGHRIAAVPRRDEAKLPHDKISRSAVEGDPAKVMVEEARRLGARIIVVGNRRVQGASRVLGSIAGDVLKTASCDVLIVNTTGKSD